MDINELRKKASFAAENVVEETALSLLGHVDRAHAQGDRQGVFMDASYRLGDGTFPEHALEDLMSRLEREGLEVHDIGVGGATLSWSNESTRFAAATEAELVALVEEWISFFEGEITAAAEAGEYSLEWEGDLLDDDTFHARLHAHFANAGLEVEGIGPRGMGFDGRVHVNEEIDLSTTRSTYVRFDW